MGEEENKELTRARNAAYRLLTYRPRSRAELEAKLREKEFDDAIVQQVIDGLTRLGYVNDRQFAKQWTASRSKHRQFGRRRIEQELRNKGISRDLIKETLGDVLSQEDELETAKTAARKKIATMHSLDRETRRRRLAGFLERKGFSFEIIRVALQEAKNNAAP